MLTSVMALTQFVTLTLTVRILLAPIVVLAKPNFLEMGKIVIMVRI